MADTQRFVNTASSGGDGTTNDTSGATAAYASLSAWESAEQGTVATGDRHIVDCCGTAADTTAVSVAGWTVTDVDSLIIRGNRSHAAGFYDGEFEYSTSHYRIDTSSNTSQLTIDTGAGVLVDGIQISRPDFNGRHGIAWSAGGSVINCRIRGSDIAGGGGSPLWLRTFPNSSYRAQNNIISRNAESSGILLAFSNFRDTDTDVSNNTIFGCLTGIEVTEATSNTGTIRLHNNAVANCTTDFSHTGTGVTVTATHNASDDLFGTSTQDLSPGTPEADEWPNHWTAPNAAAGSKDFNVVASGALDGNGTTGSGIPTTDILGATRHATTPSIGAFEVAAGGGGGATIPHPIRRRRFASMLAR